MQGKSYSHSSSRLATRRLGLSALWLVEELGRTTIEPSPKFQESVALESGKVGHGKCGVVVKRGGLEGLGGSFATTHVRIR